MIRKYLIIIGCLLFAIGLCGCKKENTSVNNNMEPATENSSGDQEETKEVIVTEVPKEKKQVVEEEAETGSEVQELHVISVNYESKLLGAALDGSTPSKQILIYLPSSYYSSEKSYPVVYFFHGYGDSPMFVRTSEKKFDTYMEESGKEFIVVGVDGRTTSSKGSFYANSPVTGPWKDHVIQEIIPGYRKAPNIYQNL